MPADVNDFRKEIEFLKGGDRAMENLTLGLDLGPNSIGWALVDEATRKIVGLGVRVFPEGVDNFDTGKEVSRNEERRTMRGMRRQVRRRARRRRQLRDALVQAGLFPKDPAEQAKLCQQDPYELRARALTEKLAPFELGRVLFHLAQRRGFLSNAKHDRSDKEVKGMLEEMGILSQEIEASGCETLGQFLHAKRNELKHSDRKPDDLVRGRHTRRQMYIDEFNTIWARQQDLGHDELLIDQLKYGKSGNRRYPSRPKKRVAGESPLEAFGLFGLIFYQRKMYWPKSVIGLCELEPKELRCPRGDRQAQKFRLLQEVNNLRYVDQDAGRSNEEPLSDEYRTLLLAKLERKEKMTFDQIRKALGFTDSVRFNLEKGKRSSIWGMVVDCRMAKAIGPEWHERPEADKDSIVRGILDNELDSDEEAAKLAADWQMTDSQAQAAVRVDLPAGYIHFSRKALARLLPHLERGLVLQSSSDPEVSAIHAAGYLRRDELQRRLFDRLPDPHRIRDCPIGDIPNPVVKRTLVELRKVVNAIIREYGCPTAIHVEMGRDVKTRPQMGSPAYAKYIEQLNERNRREKQRDDAASRLRELGVTVNRDNITRVVLWEEQSRECIYSGKSISMSQLFGGDVDVDHILPRSRSLDDSQSNKVVCFRRTNADKAQQTPYEWLAAKKPEDYDTVCQRAGKHLKEGRFSYAKYRRFLQKEVKTDDFIERQLNDTRYIARATGEYLRCLFEADHQVLGLRGQHTFELRHLWGLDTVLAELPDSPAWQQKDQLRPFEKNRADHRHHAVDALLLALINRARLHALSSFHQGRVTRRSEDQMVPPWESFRNDAKEALAGITVSHRPEKKVRGKLHEETLYGKTKTEGLWVARKPVETLSPNEIEHIRDRGIRRVIIDRLRAAGIEYGWGKKVDAKTWKAVLSDLTMPSGIPIKKVRVLKPEQTVQAVREAPQAENSPGNAYAKPGSTHHLCIFEFEEDGKRRREAVFVTMLEAMSRLARHEEVVRRKHPSRPDAQFIMSLSRGDMVQANWKGHEKLLVYRTAASTQGQIYFTEHTDSRRSKDAKKFVANANTLDAQKVTVDMLGCVRRAGN